MTDSVILDPAALDRLREWGGEKLLGQMVRIFLENSPTRMKQIRAGAAGDIAETERGAHSLKSSAANLGLEVLRAAAAEMEGRASSADAESVAALLPGLEDAYATAYQAVESVERGLSE